MSNYRNHLKTVLITIQGKIFYVGYLKLYFHSLLNFANITDNQNQSIFDRSVTIMAYIKFHGK